MRNSTLLYGRDLLWIASEMLEILTIIFRIIFNNNPCRPCVPWIFLGLLRKKSLGEIFNEIWPMARNQSSSEFKRMLDGCFLVARAQEIFGGNLV